MPDSMSEVNDGDLDLVGTDGTSSGVSWTLPSSLAPSPFQCKIASSAGDASRDRRSALVVACINRTEGELGVSKMAKTSNRVPKVDGTNRMALGVLFPLSADEICGAR